MRTSLIAALLCAAGLVFACGCAPPSDKEQKQFLEYKAKAEKGDLKAQNSLGLCYDTGYGVKQDHTEALKWYRKAAELNDATAQYNLGCCYYDGEVVEKDYAEAVKWFRKSAEQNDTRAQNSLGFCYANGQGVEKNYAEGYAWVVLADLTDETAVRDRGRLKNAMSPQQVADAQTRAKELRAQIEAQLKSGGK
jgi:TPR repeat protein